MSDSTTQKAQRWEDFHRTNSVDLYFLEKAYTQPDSVNKNIYSYLVDYLPTKIILMWIGKRVEEQGITLLSLVIEKITNYCGSPFEDKFEDRLKEFFEQNGLFVINKDIDGKEFQDFLDRFNAIFDR